MSNKGLGAFQTASFSSKAHRADIDGLRAVAILGVLAYHFGFGVSGGYGGVDVFFVISGFLIAGLIKADLEAGSFSLAQFYVRRIRRIMPALTVCLLATTMAAAFIFFPRDFKNYGLSLLAAATSTSNFFFMSRTGYFDSAAIEKPLLHTWSLGVEEQFYIFFPVGLLLLFKFARKSVFPVLAAVTALSLAYGNYSAERSPNQAFFSTLGRAWELGMGALLAFDFLYATSRRWLQEAEGVVGLLLIAFGYFFYTDETPFPGLTALPLCLGAVLIIHAGMMSQTSAVARVLSSPPMVGIGLISYSVYLWHWPLLVLSQSRFSEIFGSDAPHAMPARLGLAAASLCLGALSWRFVEEPFRRSKARPRNTVFAAGALATLIIVGISALVIARPMWLQSWPASIDAMQFRRTVSGRVLGLPQAIGWTPDSYIIDEEGSAPDTLLWGDSFAQALIPGFVSYHREAGRGVVIAAKPGCPPLLEVSFYGRSDATDCESHNDAIFKKLAAPEIKRVVLVARWSSFAKSVVRDNNGNPAMYGRRGGQANGGVFASVLEATVRRLTEHNKEVVIVGPTPAQAFDVAPAMARHIVWGNPLPPELTFKQFAEDEHLVLPLLSRMAAIAHVRVVYPHLYLCDAESCHYSHDGEPMYSDDGHLSPVGVAELSRMFDEMFNGGAKS